MPRKISNDQVLLYEFARYIRPEFFMVSEASRVVGIRENSAARHALDFEQLGIFESRDLHPEQMFKIRPEEYLQHIDLVRRLEEALSLMKQQRQTHASRAAAAASTMAGWPGAGQGNPQFNRPHGRREGDVGPRE